jgi:hypothetical protein
MTRDELISRIRELVPQSYAKFKRAESAAAEYDELTKFPELKDVIIDLLTSDFNNFLASIDWVAPKPTTFRINLKNNQEFYLIWNSRSWIAQVEGKKYYLLNLPEQQHATESIARILRYGAKAESATAAETAPETTPETTPEETPAEA